MDLRTYTNVPHRILASAAITQFSGTPWVRIAGRNVWECSCGWKGAGQSAYALPTWLLGAHLAHWHDPNEVFTYINHGGSSTMTAQEIIDFPDLIREMGRKQREEDQASADAQGITLLEYRRRARGIHQ